MDRERLREKLEEAERKTKALRKVLLEGISEEAMEAIAWYVEAGLPVFRTHDAEGRLRTDISCEMLQLDAARRDGKMSVYHWLVMQRKAAQGEQ